MERMISLEQVEPIAIGAGVLGTGGGGNTYLGALWLREMIRQHGTPRIIDADDLPDDALAVAVGKMGAPTVSIEKLAQGDEMANAVRGLEAHLGRRMDALLIGEIGGSNSLMPLICGLQLGLPIVDGDGMGRAFPELQMDTFSIAGTPHHPMALGDSHGNAIIFHKLDSTHRAEQYARVLTISMGGSAGLAMPLATGAQVKAALIRGTLTLAERIGRAVLNARKAGGDPADAISAITHGRVLFRGKIVDVERRTVQGFARGRMRLAPFGGGAEMVIDFQNENLIARVDGAIVAAVPDLISLIGLEDGEPIGTESLRYGLRVAVLGMPAPKELKTPRALEFVGPAAFGYPDVQFTPMPGDLL
ncbi:MAG: DUF917 domain-containing protein [Phototrophicales bacterium]|nr:MAG: DUF917 domain-containing protein [Phototrophicales bacterium]